MGSDSVSIRPLEAADAQALVACFERCYEGTYPADAFHDPDQVAERVAQGRLRSVVAVAAGDEVVGHMGLTLRPDGALTAEAGNTVVDPRYRGDQLAGRLAVELSRLCLELGMIGFHHYPTTAHPVMQKLAVSDGGVEMGVLLDYIPEQTRYVGFDAPEVAGRVAVTVVYQPLAEAPAGRVWLPDRHLELAETLYARAKLPREVTVADAGLPLTDARMALRFEERRGLLRVEVGMFGVDLRARVAAEAERHAGCPVLVDLPLAEPSVGAATDALAEDGFCFGALLPEYTAAGDVLRLQRPSERSPAPDLATPEARALLAYIIRDRAPAGSA